MTKLNKSVVLPFIISLAVIVCFAVLRTTGIIAITCPVSYLNPWQYFFYCQMFYALIYLAIGIPVFLIAFLIVKKARRF